MPQSPLDISRVISPQSVVYGGGKPLGLTPLCSVEAGDAWSITQLDWTTHFLPRRPAGPSHQGRRDFGPNSAGPFHRRNTHRRGVRRFRRRIPCPARNRRPQRPLQDPQFRYSAIPTNAPFAPDYVYISAEAAHALVAAKVNLVGVDYLNVDRHGDHTNPAHRALLGNNILILEGLDLSRVAPGRYQLIALPLRIANGDGSPVRAVLIPLQG